MGKGQLDGGRDKLKRIFSAPTLMSYVLIAGIVGGVILDEGPAVAAGTITQIAPSGGSGDHGTPFSDQLETLGNLGRVTFATDSATSGGSVSSAGVVSAPETTPVGRYFLFGTDSDASGDTGVWRYTLTIAGFPGQTPPTLGTVTTSGSADFTAHLRATGYRGPITFIKGGGGTGLKVSLHGKITTTGTLAVGTYAASGTMSDAYGDTGSWRYTLTVMAVPITQTAPTSGAVPPTRSATFTDHLRTTGNIGPVAFTETGGGPGIKVSPHGKITTTGTLAAGTYTTTGTDADAFGDTGIFTYTLTVGGPPPTQTAPTSGTVTTSGSAAFIDHLRTAGNYGPITFIKGGGGTGLKVSLHGKITTTGTLAAGTYTATGTLYDAYGDTGTWSYALTVTAVPITQTAPTEGSVAPGTPFSDQLETMGNLGPVTFVTDSPTTWGSVSSTGAVSASDTTPIGNYFLFGTDSDAFGDTGVWRYTLTVGLPPPITQAAPTSGTVTTSGSAAFTDHLRTTANIGPVTFTKGRGGTGLKVSLHGKITTNGILAVGTYTATGTMSDAYGDTGSFTFTLTVMAVPITQTAPTSGSVAYGTPLVDRLQTTGNIGQVAFVTDSATPWGSVSSAGVISAPDRATPGVYFLFGTDSDNFGDMGQWQYTLTVFGVGGLSPLQTVAPTLVNSKLRHNNHQDSFRASSDLLLAS